MAGDFDDSEMTAGERTSAALRFILSRYAYSNGEPREDMPAWAHVMGELLIGLPVDCANASPWLAALDQEDAARGGA